MSWKGSNQKDKQKEKDVDMSKECRNFGISMKKSRIKKVKPRENEDVV